MLFSATRRLTSHREWNIVQAMNREEIFISISQKTSSKIVLLVMDGLGGFASEKGIHTELEKARTPNLDRLAASGVCGVTDPVLRGITPGSGPAHLSLFGYDPTQYLLGRGILEALGVGMSVGKNDLVARGNFATQKNGVVLDRRALNQRTPNGSFCELSSTLRGWDTPLLGNLKVCLGGCFNL